MISDKPTIVLPEISNNILAYYDVVTINTQVAVFVEEVLEYIWEYRNSIPDDIESFYEELADVLVSAQHFLYTPISVVTDNLSKGFLNTSDAVLELHRFLHASRSTKKNFDLEPYCVNVLDTLGIYREIYINNGAEKVIHYMEEKIKRLDKWYRHTIDAYNTTKQSNR